MWFCVYLPEDLALMLGQKSQLNVGLLVDNDEFMVIDNQSESLHFFCLIEIIVILNNNQLSEEVMKHILLALLVFIALAWQTSANFIRNHETTTVVSAMLYEPYVAAFLSLILLIATLI